MRRTEIALAVLAAVLVVWIGFTRATAAQAAQTQLGSGRFTMSLVSKMPLANGSNRGYYAILLDTHSGRMWASVGSSEKIEAFEPVSGPMDPRRPPQDAPGGEPRH